MKKNTAIWASLLLCLTLLCGCRPLGSGALFAQLQPFGGSAAAPQFDAAVIGWNTTALATANTTMDGTSGSVVQVFGQVNREIYVDRIEFVPLGTNVATVVRVFVNNGSSKNVAANNSLILEETLPITTLSQTAKMSPVTVYTDRLLPPGYRLYVTVGTTVAAGYRVNVYGGNYQPF